MGGPGAGGHAAAGSQHQHASSQLAESTATRGVGITFCLHPTGIRPAGTVGARGKGQCLVSPCWVSGLLTRLSGVYHRYMFHGGTNFAYWSGE